MRHLLIFGVSRRGFGNAAESRCGLGTLKYSSNNAESHLKKRVVLCVK